MYLSPGKKKERFTPAGGGRVSADCAPRGKERPSISKKKAPDSQSLPNTDERKGGHKLCDALSAGKSGCQDAGGEPHV